MKKSSILGLLKFLIILAAALMVCIKVKRYADLKIHHDESVSTASLQLKLTKSESLLKQEPIILWWTPFTKEDGKTKSFRRPDGLEYRCFFTVNRAYQNHPMTKVFMFYGTDFEYGDLPLPRKPQHHWALLHEESPKNNNYLFSHNESLSLFNHTSTFRRESDCPITTQFLKNLDVLEGKEYLMSIEEKNRAIRDEGLALINYVYSDCDPPSDRDRLVKALQRFIKVDSYGKCLHNKDLPEHLRDGVPNMMHVDFLRILAKYKFTIASENAICDDYITEKLWRPLHVGSVPIVLGSRHVKDFLPDNHSAIIVNDFTNISDIISLLLRLNSSDSEYSRYLEFKTPGGVTNALLRETMKQRAWRINEPPYPNFIDNFEQHVCRTTHERLKQEELGITPTSRMADAQHYGCPKPERFSVSSDGILQRVHDDIWARTWTDAKYRATALLRSMESGRMFTRLDVDQLSAELQRLDIKPLRHPSDML